MTKENQSGVNFKYKEKVLDIIENDILEVSFVIEKAQIVVCKTSYGTYRNVYLNDVRKLTPLEKELI